MTSYYYCLEHQRVEPDAAKCRAENRLGPYPTEEAARDWKQQVEHRNETWDEDDEAWNNWGEDGDEGADQ